MKIDIRRFPEDGKRFEGDEPPEILDLEPGDLIRGATELIRYKFFAELLSQDLIVRGTVSAGLKMACSRCTEIFSTSVSDSAFLRAYEIEPDQEEVDVTPDLREAVLLHAPSFPLCTENCAGLCPQCGTNRNRGQCSCSGKEADLRWDTLDSLRFNTD